MLPKLSSKATISSRAWSDAYGRKTRDGKQRFAVPVGEFGKCICLNDVPLHELKSALRTHKAFIKSRFGSGEGKEAYVDAGDLGADLEAYVNGKANANQEAPSKQLLRNGINGDYVKEAAVKAGAVPVDGTGHVTNGVSS